MNGLQMMLESMDFECQAKDGYIIASSGRINDEIRALCDDTNGDYCDQIRFIVWYDGHIKYEERGERLLRIRIPTPVPELPEEIKYKICSDVNLHIKIGRFNGENMIPHVEWACFVNGEVDRKSIEQAMVHLGESFVVASKVIKRATEWFKKSPR